MKRLLVVPLIGLAVLGLAGCGKKVVEAEPVACPIATDDFTYTWGVNPDDVGSHVAAWMNEHPVESWPVISPRSELPDTRETAQLIEDQVFQPMGCDDSAISLLTRIAVGDAYIQWDRAQHPLTYVDSNPAKDYGSHGGGHARCRMGFGTGGFSWSCSVST